MFTPKRMFFTKGVGVHKEQLSSFEIALRDAGVAPCNLVSVSSIYPSGCTTIHREEGIRSIEPGQITFCVMAREQTNEPGRHMHSAIGLAIPADTNKFGYLSEVHGFGKSEKESSDYAEDLAASMLATTLGLTFDPDANYDERREVYMMSGEIVRSESICQFATGEAHGKWTTVVAMAILLP